MVGPCLGSLFALALWQACRETPTFRCSQKTSSNVAHRFREPPAVGPKSSCQISARSSPLALWPNHDCDNASVSSGASVKRGHSNHTKVWHSLSGLERHGVCGIGQPLGIGPSNHEVEVSFPRRQKQHSCPEVRGRWGLAKTAADGVSTVCCLPTSGSSKTRRASSNVCPPGRNRTAWHQQSPLLFSRAQRMVPKEGPDLAKEHPSPSLSSPRRSLVPQRQPDCNNQLSTHP